MSTHMLKPKRKKKSSVVKLPAKIAFPQEVFVATVTPNEVFATKTLDRILDTGVDGEEIAIYTLQEVRRISRRVVLI
jgi:hypothetical protein